MAKVSGVYQIRNLVNSKIYVGSSVDIKRRWATHKIELCRSTHRNTRLQNSWNKYGKESFKFEVIENCKKELLIKREQYWIDSLNVCKVGYNINPIAGSRLGSKLSKETKKKMSDSAKGRKCTEESKKKMSEARKGITFSEDHKKKLSKAWKERKPATEETKRKIGEASKGRKHTEESKKKMSELKKGIKPKPFSEEHKKRISEVRKGTKHTEEAKFKMKEAWRKRKGATVEKLL